MCFFILNYLRSERCQVMQKGSAQSSSPCNYKAILWGILKLYNWLFYRILSTRTRYFKDCFLFWSWLCATYRYVLYLIHAKLFFSLNTFTHLFAYINFRISWFNGPRSYLIQRLRMCFKINRLFFIWNMFNFKNRLPSGLSFLWIT